MKRYNFIGGAFMALVVGLGIFSCEETDIDRTFTGPYHVRFTDSTVVYRESNSNPIVVRVHNAGPQLDQPVTVRYTVGGNAREGRDYTILGTKGTVVIPAKQSFGEIQLQLINNANNILESQDIIFTITEVTPASLQIGLGKNNPVGKQLKFTIQDDCLLSGSYVGVRRVGQQAVTVRDIEITSVDCREYRVGNWNLGFFNLNAEKPTLTFIDNGDNSLTIPAQRNDYLAAPRDTIQGNGAWNPRDRQITLNLRLKLRIPNTERDTIITQTLTYIPQ
ncbi:hypothetical protein [Nibrella saemangeumensis]